MNVTLIKTTVDALKGSPILLVILILNVIVFAGFGYTLHSVSAAMERREALLKACIEKT